MKKSGNRTRVDRRTLDEVVMNVVKYRNNYYYKNESGQKTTLT